MGNVVNRKNISTPFILNKSPQNLNLIKDVFYLIYLRLSVCKDKFQVPIRQSI